MDNNIKKSSKAKDHAPHTSDDKQTASQRAKATIEYFLKRGAKLGTKTGGILMPSSMPPPKGKD